MLRRVAHICLWAILGMAGCRGDSLQYSEHFVTVFGEDAENSLKSSRFRGVRFGMTPAEVVKTESLDPLHSDDFGVKYETKTPDGLSLSIDYLQHPERKDGIRSIIIEMMLPEELEVIDLYRETEGYLNQFLGIPNGVRGDYSWNSEQRRMRAFLSLSEDKTSISLNLLPLEGVMETANPDSIRNQN